METSEMNDLIISVFWQKCVALQKRWEVALQPSEFEELLVDLLVYIKSNTDQKDCFIAAFSDLVYDRKKGPLEILIFCMRELQWPEIKAEVLYRIQNSDDLRVKDSLMDILDVYEENWPDAAQYKYYRSKDFD
jgi:hypothetical protein